MATRSKARRRDGSRLIVEHHGLLWKPTAEATVSFDDFLGAKARFRQVMDDDIWNPWNRESHAPEISRLGDVLEQWTRAEPGFRRLTDQEYEQLCEQRDVQREAEQAEQARQREARKELYDPAREAARLELLERKFTVKHQKTDVVELRDGTPFPNMDSQRRTDEIAELERSIEDGLVRVARLHNVVGDVETVSDASGALPSERRETALSVFGTWRYCEVTRLRECLNTARNTLQAAEDKAAKTETRTRISLGECRLKALLAVPRPTAELMYPDCMRPVDQHCWRTSGGMSFYAGPPVCAKRVRS